MTNLRERIAELYSQDKYDMPLKRLIKRRKEVCYIFANRAVQACKEEMGLDTD